MSGLSGPGIFDRGSQDTILRLHTDSAFECFPTALQANRVVNCDDMTVSKSPTFLR
jgi:hypothetical protein